MEFYQKVILLSGRIQKMKLKTGDFCISAEDTILVKNLLRKNLIPV